MAFCCCWIFLRFKKTSGTDPTGRRLHVALRQPFPCNTTASPIRGISMNDESYEGIKREGTSQTRGESVLSGNRANVSIHQLQPSARLPPATPCFAWTGQQRSGSKARCASPQGRAGMNHHHHRRHRRRHFSRTYSCQGSDVFANKMEMRFQGNTGNKKPWILWEALVSRSCKAVFWGFSHHMRRMEIH